MKEVPISEYVCETCGARFSSFRECSNHEEKCRARNRRIKNCKYCSGRGYTTKVSEGQYAYRMFGVNYYHPMTFSRIPCPHCNYE